MIARKVFVWLQLMRLPNVFTVWADVTMAFCVVQCRGIFELTPMLATAYALTLAASSLMYIAGMILNDVHDVPEDERLRAERPIALGRISLNAARRAGYGMLTAGVMLFVTAASVMKAWGAGPLVITLAVCILAYNTRVKDTLAGPVLMGLCRAVNIFAVMAVAEPAGVFQVLAQTDSSSLVTTYVAWKSPLFLIPCAIFVYITGVTFYARNETEEGMEKSGVLGGAMAVLMMIGGILILLPWLNRLYDHYPICIPVVFTAQRWRWSILVLFLAVYGGMKNFIALLSGNPLRVRRGVKQAIFTLFIIDAALVFTVAGMPSALLIIGMMLAATAMGRWVYST